MAQKKQTPKPGTKADLENQLNAARQKLNESLQMNSYLSRLTRAGLGRALGQSFAGDRDLYSTLGYKLDPEYIDYLNMYERDGLATRVIDSVSDETWREHPVLFESEEKAEDEKAEPGPLQNKFKELADKHDLWAQFNEVDRMLGISRFSLLYLGLPGQPEEPVQKGKSNKLAYVIVCDEGVAEVDEASIEVDVESERFGMPEFYWVTIDEATEIRKRVHYTRVVHVKEGRQRIGGLGRVYGIPRMKKIINRLQDLEKVLGGGSEAYWLLIYRGMALMAKEGFTLPGKDSDEYEAMQDEIDEFIHGLRRYIRLQGMELQDLGGKPIDSRAQFDVIVEYIAGAMRIPQRILLGSERGNLASSQDDLNFMDYIDSRRKNFAEPYILRPFLSKLDELGILDLPDGYYIDWPSLFQLTDLEKADLAGKVASAMTSASGGAPETIIPPKEFAKRYLDFVWTPEMERDQMQAEEQARNEQGGAGGFGGGQGGGNGSAPTQDGGGGGFGSFAPDPTGELSELDLSQFKAVLRVGHGGPGPHKSGSSQDVHGDRGAGGGDSGGKITSFPTRPASEDLTDEQDRQGWVERKLIDDNGQEVVFKETPEEYKKGVFTSFRVTVEGDGDAILKTNVYTGYKTDGWGDENLEDGFAKREVAAYKVDQALGLGVVPETIGLEWGSEGNKTAYRYQSLQKWVDDATAGYDASGFNPSDLKEPADIGRILLLDKIIGQNDRHGYNWLVADGRIVAIDHGLGLIYNDEDPVYRGAFPMMYSAFGIDRSVNNPNVNRPYLPRSYRDSLRSAIDSGDLYKALSEVGTDEKNDRLVSSALFRAENIYNNWDSYFSDENWY